MWNDRIITKMQVEMYPFGEAWSLDSRVCVVGYVGFRK